MFRVVLEKVVFKHNIRNDTNWNPVKVQVHAKNLEADIFHVLLRGVFPKNFVKFKGTHLRWRSVFSKIYVTRLVLSY